jgi:hypothetical protein
MNLALSTLEVAKTQLGKQEIPKGSNGGPDVEKYLKSVGLGVGYSWCMAFVYWCTKEAADAAKVINPLVRTGGVMRQWNENTKLRAATPRAGDIFIMDFGKGLGHTGFVERVEGTTLYTIEGNTNDDGSREGYEVCRRTRQLKQIKGFLRLPDSE